MLTDIKLTTSSGLMSSFFLVSVLLKLLQNINNDHKSIKEIKIMKKDKRNSTVSFSSHPSFVIQTINDQDWKPRESIKEDEPVVAPLVELPPPPDGGWGWVIVFASFMCNLILGK